MLSRVAERVYWMARYLERAENTARMVNAYVHLMLDLPRAIQPGWQRLIDVTGEQELFFNHYQNANERNTVKFLLADRFNSGSIYQSLALARENLRTTRDVVPTEAFEKVNEMFLYAHNSVDGAIIRRGRYAFLTNIIQRCQQIAGLLAGAMSRGAAYDFVSIGRNLERADMTTRIVDVGATLLIPRREEPQAYDSVLWVYLLKSLNADQMYRHHVRRRVDAEHVVKYLIQNHQFPRSVAHCLEEVVMNLKNLPRNDAALRSMGRLQRVLNETEIGSNIVEELPMLMDKLQIDMGKVHEQVANTWFTVDYDVPNLQAVS